MQRDTINLLGIDIDALDTTGLRDKIVAFTQTKTARTVMYVNADCMLIARKNKQYQHVLNQADLVYADGVGVVWGAKLWGHSLPGRSTGADFMPDFCQTFADIGLRLFFLGASPGVAEQAAKQLRKKIPNLLITGTHHGYFTPEQEQEVITKIQSAKPDIVVVGLGAPYQEFWISEHADTLGGTVLWGVGGLFDFLSGNTKRGPQWLLDHGFEWLCRLLTEPKRLWRRYLIGNTTFIFYLLQNRFFKGAPRSNDH